MDNGVWHRHYRASHLTQAAEASSLSSRNASLSLFSRGGGDVDPPATVGLSRSPYSSLSLVPTPLSLQWWNDWQWVVGRAAGRQGRHRPLAVVEAAVLWI